MSAIYKSPINKSRNISTADYFVNLQKEYLIAELRKKIHFKQADQKYWEKVALYKKERIDKISIQSNIPSIFSNQRTYEEIKFSIYGKAGLPSFIYKDQADYENLYIKDIYGYFAKNIEVRCEIEELGIVVARVLYVNLIKQVVVVQYKEYKYSVTYNSATRTL